MTIGHLWEAIQHQKRLCPDIVMATQNLSHNVRGHFGSLNGIWLIESGSFIFILNLSCIYFVDGIDEVDMFYRLVTSNL